MRITLIATLLILAGRLAGDAAGAADPQTAAGDAASVVNLTHTGMCDASAAAALTDKLFIAADDEGNVLRVYRNDAGGQPVYQVDLAAFLQVDPDHPETDIEGATRIADRVYWITSHGRNKDGRLRPNRYRFFATQVKVDGDDVKVTPVGVPYRRLVADLLADRRLAPMGLAQATRLDDDRISALAPKEHGLSIEALAATPDARSILIAFRNPRPDDKALIVPLTNADAVVDGRALAQFGPPILLDLAGLGIRSIEYVPTRGQYLIVAGSHKDGGPFRLYQWSGRGNDAPTLLHKFEDEHFHPEAIVALPATRRIGLLSDDGTVKISGVTCKALADPANRRFKSQWFQP